MATINAKEVVEGSVVENKQEDVSNSNSISTTGGNDNCSANNSANNVCSISTHVDNSSNNINTTSSNDSSAVSNITHDSNISINNNNNESKITIDNSVNSSTNGNSGSSTGSTTSASSSSSGTSSDTSSVTSSSSGTSSDTSSVTSSSSSSSGSTSSTAAVETKDHHKLQESASAPSIAQKKQATKEKSSNLRAHFKRGNTVASTNPLEFQEFATQQLDKERQQLNAATNAANALKKLPQPGEERQIKEVPFPEKSPLSYADLFGVDDKPDYVKLKRHFLREGKLELGLAKTLITRATELFREQPNLIELEAPYTVCGDIHGQFYDLVNLLDNAGDPRDTPYLFLGDYVDRGCFSCEVCFLLYAMKICYPASFHLIRGNHESRAMTNIHNFKVECLKKYGQEAYDLFMVSFDCMPLAAVLRCRLLGRFFCVHGGLSPNIETLEDIQVLNRFEEVPADGAITDLLWSDPILEDEQMTARDILEFRELEFADNVERGIGYFFGFKAITDFLLKNNLVSIVRAHEVQQEGCTEHMFTRTDLSIPMAFTVFSAPNYCDFYSNKSAFIKFSHNKYEVYQLECVPHPYWLPDFQNVFAFSIDYVLDAVHTVLKNLAKDVDKDEPEKVDWISEASSDYLKRLSTFQAKIKTPRANIDENLSPLEKFKKAREMDLKLEKTSPITRNKNIKSRVLKRNVSSYF